MNMATRALWIVRVLLGVLILFWLVAGATAVFLWLTRGAEAVNQYVMHITFSGTRFPLSGDSPDHIHTAYHALIGLLLLTWVLRELAGFLGKRTKLATLGGGTT
jgi:hypothetical protein